MVKNRFRLSLRCRHIEERKRRKALAREVSSIIESNLHIPAHYSALARQSAQMAGISAKYRPDADLLRPHHQTTKATCQWPGPAGWEPLKSLLQMFGYAHY